MTANDLRDVLGRRPFQPIQVRLSSGDVYEIRHPENALLLRTGVYVALPPDGDALPERAVFCSLLHVAAIETVGT